MVVFNNRLYMTEFSSERNPATNRSNGKAYPKHLMDTSHMSATPSNPDRFKIEIKTDTVTDNGIAMEGYVSSHLTMAFTRGAY